MDFSFSTVANAAANATLVSVVVTGALGGLRKWPRTEAEGSTLGAAWHVQASIMASIPARVTNSLPAILITVRRPASRSLRRPATVIPPIGKARATASARRSGTSLPTGCWVIRSDLRIVVRDQPPERAAGHTIHENSGRFIVGKTMSKLRGVRGTNCVQPSPGGYRKPIILLTRRCHLKLAKPCPTAGLGQYAPRNARVGGANLGANYEPEPLQCAIGRGRGRGTSALRGTPGASRIRQRS